MLIADRARRPLPSRAIAAAFVALVVATAACRSADPSPPGPTSRGTPSSVTPSSARSATSSAERQTTPAPSGPSPSFVDSASILRLCGNGPDQSSDIDCKDAIDVALAVARPLEPPLRGVLAWSMFCPIGTACPSAAQEPDQAYVVLYLADGSGFQVPVRLENGGLVPGSPAGITANDLGPRETFVSPSVSRADVGPAPATVLNRPALPLCGAENAGLAGPFDVAARNCFLSSLLAGSSAEFASQRSDVGGAAFLELWRFAGAGPVTVYRRESRAWSQLVCGVALVADTDQQFDHTDCSSSPVR